jgi:proteasome lid subunit RPN8/RPN11
MAVFIMLGFRLDAEARALKVFPKESCGFVVNGKYLPCRNIAENPLTEFIIEPKDYLSALDAGEIEAIVHSHTNGKPPSKPDLFACQQLGVDWYLWEVTSNTWWIIQPSLGENGAMASMIATH